MFLHMHHRAVQNLALLCCVVARRVETLKVQLQPLSSRGAHNTSAATSSSTPPTETVLPVLENLVAELSGIQGEDAETCGRLLEVCRQLAAAHNSLHRLTAMVGSPAAAADWQRELAECALLDYEDDMEAHYLLLRKHNAKWAGEIGYVFSWLGGCNHGEPTLFALGDCWHTMVR